MYVRSGRVCCVFGCQNTERKNPQLSFYSFPGRKWEIKRKQDWINAIRAHMPNNADWMPNKNTRICCMHFVLGKKTEEEYSASYIPSIFPIVNIESSTNVKNTFRVTSILSNNSTYVPTTEIIMSDTYDLQSNSSDQPFKKKCKRLSNEEGIMIVNKLDDYSKSGIAREFCLSSATTSKIDGILENLQNVNSNFIIDNQYNLDNIFYNTLFEKSIYNWYKQKRCLCEPVPAQLFRKKAAALNKKMNRSDSFKPDDPWLEKFKERYNINTFPTERSNMNDIATTKYCEDLIKLIREHNIDPNNIYNADETVLAWKSIPKERLFYEKRNIVKNADTVTVMVCCNATGTHKLPLLIIGSNDLQNSMSKVALPIIYENQNKGHMNQEIFIKWYNKVFHPQIRERHPNDNDLVLLIIDSAPPHPSSEVLIKGDVTCVVRPIHFEITPYIQPLNQGIIHILKVAYKTKLLSKLLSQNSLVTDKLCENFTLIECCTLLVDAWEQISKNDIIRPWQRIIFGHENHFLDKKNEMHFINLLPLIHKIPGYSQYNLLNTKAWIDEDSEMPGWEVLSEDEIINKVIIEHQDAIKQYKTHIQNNRSEESHKMLISNNDIKSDNVDLNLYNSKIIIKEEIDDLVLNENEIKNEITTSEETVYGDEDIDMSRNAIFLDEYSDDYLQLEEEPEQDRLIDTEPIDEIKESTNVGTLTDELYVVTPEKGNFFREDIYKKNMAPSAFEAMSSIDIVYKWFENKAECTQEDLIRLRQMREIARKEILVTVNKP